MLEMYEKFQNCVLKINKKIKNYVLENLNENEKNELTFDILNGYDFEDDLDMLIYCMVERVDNVGELLADGVEYRFYGTFKNFKKYYINYMNHYVDELKYNEYEWMLREYKIKQLNKYIKRFRYELLEFIYKQILKKYKEEINEQIVDTYNSIKEECF